jgi:two-component system cell cycle sensor histidine kinase/response regulator CckA
VGPYVAVTIALVGFALFAGAHHLYLWAVRRERTSLLFAICCVLAALFGAAHVATASATTIAAGQIALDLRTTIGLLNYIAVAWLVSAISGVHAKTYRVVLGTVLGSGVIVNLLMFSLSGSVSAVYHVTLPWGEQATQFTRNPPPAGWLPRLMYAAISTVQIYALIGARRLWRRDRTAATLMALAGIAGMAGVVIGLMIDTQIIRWPYVGQLALAAWIILMATLLSREHARRGELLEDSEASLAAVISNSPGVAIQWYDSDGRVLMWNHASEQMFGYSEREALGKTLDALMLPAEEFASFRDTLNTIARTNQPAGPAEFTFRRRGADPGVCVSTIFQIPPGHDGRPRFACMDVDISERKRAELALTVSEARYRTLIESAPEAIVVLDVDRGTFADVNQQACALFALPAADLLTMNLVSLSPSSQPDGGDSRSAAVAHVDAALAGEPAVFAWTFRTASGREIPCEVRLVRLPDPGRRLVRGSISDISRRVQLEEQLRQSQKMEAIGQLASGVAHDFNNLLTVISGYAELLQQQLERGDRRRGLVDAIQDGSMRAAWLTERLLAFSRRARLTPETMNLNCVVRDAEDILRRLIGDHVQLTVTLHPASTRVRIDPGLWSQVLLNLAINARDAMPQGGHLGITTSEVEIPPVAGTSERSARQYVQLAVTDTGTGMSADVRHHIFEPFFTTKAVGKGSGLGLAVVHGIVTQAGGFIDVETAPGAGTTFRIFVPSVSDALEPRTATQGAAALAETTIKAADGAMRHETILIVDDSESVRELLDATLRPQGFRVLLANDAGEALRVLERHEGQVDLLISDLQMPGVDGRHLGRTARIRYPRLKALYISAQLDDMPRADDAVSEHHAFLRKPFSLTTLTQTVRELLDTPA